jgi:hypothetical protein
MGFGCSKLRRLLAGTAFLAAVSVCAPAYSAAPPKSCALPDMKTAERPDAGGAATKVEVGIFLADMMEIDDVKQQLTADFLVFATWRDQRLTGLEGCNLDLHQIWSPKLDFVNSGRVFPGMPERAIVGAGGTVRYVQRYRGSLSFPHRLDEFPFDEHIIDISLVPVGYRVKDVELEVDEANMGRQSDLTIPDWRLGRVAGRIDSLSPPRIDRTLSQFRFEVPAKRRPEYYLWKVLVPLMLIVAMSWSVFWINPAQFGPQIGMSATSMLTLIAFQFAMAGILPRLSYFTALDAFITASTGLVFLALVEALTTSYLVSVERKELALRFDRVCRWVFPLTFVGLVLWIFVL